MANNKSSSLALRGCKFLDYIVEYEDVYEVLDRKYGRTLNRDYTDSLSWATSAFRNECVRIGDDSAAHLFHILEYVPVTYTHNCLRLEVQVKVLE